MHGGPTQTNTNLSLNQETPEETKFKFPGDIKALSLVIRCSERNGRLNFINASRN